VIRSPESFRYVAERGYGALLGNPYQIDPELNQGLQGYRRAMKEYAGDAADDNVWVLTNGFVHEDAKFALEYPRKSVQLGIDYVLDYSRPFDDGASVPEDYKHYADWFERGRRIDYDQMVNLDSALFGSPDMVIERILKMHRTAGWRNFMVCLNRGGWMSQAEVLRTMELFATKVMPAVQAETVPA
jgi:alkanesulfonate monooxygenase SsuD/methylene tetrahydromethanopterin reductase-like flavin-dependent oxidoreductase (luciferase family)